MPRRKITDGLHQKSDGRWELSETISGKRRWFTSRDPAEVWEKRDVALKESALVKEEKDAGPLFEEVADVYEEAVCKMKNGTQKSYLPSIKRAKDWFSGKRMREVEPYMIAQFLQSLSGMAKTTVSNQKTVVNAIFQTWIDSPVWRGDYNPSELTKMPRGLKKGRRQPPTDEQVEIVKKHYMDPDALPAGLYLCTGEHRGEACGIQLQDIDFDYNILKITKAVEHINNRPHITVTKTDAGVRELPLLSMLKKALEPLRNLPPQMFVLGRPLKPLTASQYHRRWTAFWRKHGMAHTVIREQKRIRQGKEYTYHATDWVADVCAHQFRHEYVCMLCMADVPEEIAIQLVGHANIKMIHEVYMALKPQMIASTRAKLNLLLAGNEYSDPATDPPRFAT